jgi:hypothetical protein
VTRTPGVSDPVDVRRAMLDKLADEDHATAGRYYTEELTRRARAQSLASKIRRALGFGS